EIVDRRLATNKYISCKTRPVCSLVDSAAKFKIVALGQTPNSVHRDICGLLSFFEALLRRLHGVCHFFGWHELDCWVKVSNAFDLRSRVARVSYIALWRLRDYIVCSYCIPGVTRCRIH